LGDPDAGRIRYANIEEGSNLKQRVDVKLADSPSRLAGVSRSPK
jgi:hypothetical protein